MIASSRQARSEDRDEHAANGRVARGSDARRRRHGSAGGRRVELRWDFRADPPNQLEVWVDCVRAAGETIFSCPDKNRIKAPDAYHFVVKASDQVTLVVVSARDADPGAATYTITGTNMNDKDLAALRTLFGAAGGGASGTTKTGGAVKALENPPAPKADLKVVTDPLIAGGKLTVTFTLRKIEASGKEAVTASSDAVTFLIEHELPRYTVSFGLGFSTATTPSVAISKTATVLTFQKDGKSSRRTNRSCASRTTTARSDRSSR